MLNKRAQLRMENIMFTVMVGFVLLAVASWVMAEFGYTPISVKPWLQSFIFVLAAWGAWAIIFRLNYATGQKDTRKTLFVVIIAAVGLYLLFQYLPTALDSLFAVIP